MFGWNLFGKGKENKEKAEKHLQVEKPLTDEEKEIQVYQEHKIIKIDAEDAMSNLRKHNDNFINDLLGKK